MPKKPLNMSLVSSAQIAISRITSSGSLLTYSRKSVELRMEPLGTPALNGYSCEDFPSTTTPSRLLLRKDEIRPNI